MKKTLFCILFSGMLISLKAQKLDTMYFDSSWKTANSSDFSYYRVSKFEKKTYYVKDYYQNKKLQMVGSFKSLDPEIKHGKFTWFYPNGKIHEQSWFNDGKLTLTNIYNERGEKINYKGTALAFEPYLNATYISNNNKPNFPGGEEQLFKFLEDNIQYPKEISDKKIRGKVILGFTVSKNGEIGNIKVKKSLSPVMDKEAIRVLRIMPNWEPAVQNDKFVKMNTTQTFNF